ncbi:uncharacterized protein [Nicotiana tomentosiformis]|uniref:uncharacterized protein n=1 Tax=Nicotiana tomentosiformis TaxID=4098 RepID=UPI00051BD4FA|nr:uncharacterized protein LOC104088427 [Nicotiana tomentosiformis]
MKNREETSKPPLPKRMVNVITRGEEVNGVIYTAAKRTTKITVTHKKWIRQVLEREHIAFNHEDTDGLFIPHNDALVISLLVHDTNVKWVLIVPSSSITFIIITVVNEMQAIGRVIPKAWSLSRFDNSSVITKREITLCTFAEGVVKDTKFQVVDANMNYNMILGRPWIHDMDAIPSTLHQVIKFPSQWGIYQIMSDQRETGETNTVVVASGTTKDGDEK